MDWRRNDQLAKNVWLVIRIHRDLGFWLNICRTSFLQIINISNLISC